MATQIGRIFPGEAFLTLNGILVQASSMGKQLRGAQNGSYRPDLVILDDLESAKNTNTPELREKNFDWLNKVIIPIGDPAWTAIIYMGTVVHIAGLLPHVLTRADFRSKKFAAIAEPPERGDVYLLVFFSVSSIDNWDFFLFAYIFIWK